MTTLRITDQATREQITEAIAALKAKHDRLPVHYERQRGEIMDEIEGLVDMWLAASE